jgi:hypothetical protein
MIEPKDIGQGMSMTEVAMRAHLQGSLARVMNEHNIDTITNTPDHVLADMLIDFLAGYQQAVYFRDKGKDDGR